MRAVFLATVAASAVAASAPGAESWSVLEAENGAVIGYASETRRDTAEGAEVVSLQEVTLAGGKRGSVSRLRQETTTRFDRSGRVRSIGVVARVGEEVTRTEAVIGAREALVTRQTAGGRHTARVALPDGVRFDAGAGLLAGWRPAPGARLEVLNFSLEGQTVERVVLESVGSGAVLRTRYEGDELRGVARLSLSPDGRLLASTQPMFGTRITIRAVDRATALATHAPYDGLRRALFRAPYRMSDGALAGHIRYRFGFREGLRFPLPQTGEQAVRPDGEGATVDICGDCGPGLKSDAASLAEALRPTAWLQSDHPRLRAIARPVAVLKVSDERKMQLLAARARGYLGKIDFAGHFSALDTLSRRRGDCTEAAVLLAALGRAAGIPTKVASGLVYSREAYHGMANVFMPHSWVLAYVDGRWQSFDAALDAFDATHIALTVGDGDARSIAAAGQLAGLLDWSAVTEVRRRPA